MEDKVNISQQRTHVYQGPTLARKQRSHYSWDSDFISYRDSCVVDSTGQEPGDLALGDAGKAFHQCRPQVLGL